MRGWMTAAVCLGGLLVAGCAGVVGGGERFAGLQTSCGAAATDYGADAQPIYSTLIDAYVAYRHGRLSQAEYCSFEADLTRHYRMRGAGGADAQRAWADYFNA